MIAAKIMNTYKNKSKNTKNDKHVDMFGYDCSENYEQI